MRAMESGVYELWLADNGSVGLDIRALTQYSGQGKCKEVWCYGHTADRYMEKLRRWAQRINWTLKVGVDKLITRTKVGIFK